MKEEYRRAAEASVGQEIEALNQNGSPWVEIGLLQASMGLGQFPKSIKRPRGKVSHGGTDGHNLIPSASVSIQQESVQ